MLAVRLNEDRFVYDIHSLVKAFYPAQEVKVFVEGDKEFVSDGDLPSLWVTFDKESIVVRASLGEAASDAAGEPGHDGKNREEIQEKIRLMAPEERPAVKNQLKQLLYRVLSKLTGRRLPWGTLTGIRPTKIAMSMLEEGRTEQEIGAFMRDTYYCSEEKTALAIQIAAREREILAGLHAQQGYSLYIGIPFCPTTCLYCSFTSFPIGAYRKRVEEYLTALDAEIDYIKEAYGNRVLDSLYIGGGTPTTLEADQLERLLGKLERTLDLSNLLEYTVEAGRADSITLEKLQVLKRHNVTRISVNPQTMKDETLQLIGRRHSVAQVKEAFAMAREVGFDNINMDLILGLPGEKEADVAATMEEIKKLDPDNVTIHSLAVKRGSRLHEAMLNKQVFSLENTDATMEIAAAGAKAMGMEPYYLYRQKNMTGNFENVGYAKPGKAGIYNILIMEEKQTIAALGAGSISKVVLPDNRVERCDNVKDVALYIEKIGEMIDRKRQLFALT